MSFTGKLRTKLFKRRNNFTEFYSFDLKSTNWTYKEFNKIKSKKSVSFNGVQIIDVESYKEFNKLDETQLEGNDFHISRECKDCNCIII